MSDRSKLPPVTDEDADAMDDTFDTSLDVQIPAAHGGDMRAMAVLPAWIYDGLARGTLRINNEAPDQ